MACRALGRNIHRASCSLSSLRSLIAHSPIGDVPLSSSQAVQSSSSLSSLSHTGMLKGVSSSPSETLFLYSFVGQRHFSSTPYSSDSEGRPNDGVSICSSNAEDPTSPVAEGLVADSSLDIPSPAGFTIACLDALNNVTGLPWWATLSLSAVILRALLVPVKSIQIQKVAELHKIGPKLQLQRLFMGNFMEEYRQLRKRKRELSAPSFLWIHGPVIFLQVPLVVTVLYSIRKMALLNHVGFDMGGFLWKDLTVPGQGLAGAVLPFTIAAAYLANLHVLFRDYRDVDGFLGKVEKSFRKFLKYCTILVFGFSYNAPQAIHVFLAPHFLMTLLQTVLLEKRIFKMKSVEPTTRLNATHEGPGLFNGEPMVTSKHYEKLLKDAGTSFNQGDSSQAIELLRDAIKEDPEKGEAYALLGLVYKFQKDWENSATYYKEAILKDGSDDFKLAVYAGCGLALMKKGATMECVDVLRPIKNFKVPERPDSRHCYRACLAFLSRALLESGFKDESQEVMSMYKKVEVGTK